MKYSFILPLAFLLTATFCVSAFAQQREPKIGYVYPAGGRQGTTFEVLVGGRQIARSNGVIVSGNGVQGRVVRGFGTMRITDSLERKVLGQLYQDALKKLHENEAKSQQADKSEKSERQKNNESSENLPTPEEVMKKHLYLDRLANPTLRDIERIYDYYLSPRPDRKPVGSLDQGILLEMTIDADAEPGVRDFRLSGPGGLTSPVRFMVGDLPEVLEREPNDPGSRTKDHGGTDRIEIWGRPVKDVPPGLFEQNVHDLPIVFNGQIRAGDVDQFQFKARRGQKIVANVFARYLNPYLADGVPGWFQANVSLFDPKGKKIDEAMSYRHKADPVLLVEIPETGVYTLEIQDSIFRGRDDFVYRIHVGELPFITSMFPLGTRLGKKTEAEIDGWNLPQKTVLLDGNGKTPGIYETNLSAGKHLIRPLRYAVDDLPERNEKEPNGSVSNAEKLELPILVNGRISDENDVDYFSFNGRKGTRVVVDVTARSLDSPLDAQTDLLNAQGDVIASNDDRADSRGPNIGLETHHADPYINVELPDDGRYFVRIYDVTQQGGKEFAYRLRISPLRPDFQVFCEPSQLNFTGKTQPIRFHVIRQDGFDGEIDITISNASPNKNDGFLLDGARIPAGTDRITATLTCRERNRKEPFQLRFDATANLHDKERDKTHNKQIVRRVTPVDDMEQAFIYHHLVPADSFFVSNAGQRQNVSLPIDFGVDSQRRQKFLSVTLTPGQSTTLRLPWPNSAKTTNKRQKPFDADSVSFSLVDAPEGISLNEAIVNENGLTLTLTAAETMKPGSPGNVVIGINIKPDSTKPTTLNIGVLPAIDVTVR